MDGIIIFTDLDGTLLDYSYSFDKARPALDLIGKRHVPLVLCSSKSRAEIEYYRKKLDNRHPFVSENGGGIFIPKNYFSPASYEVPFPVEEEADYDVIRLGAKYSDLRKAVEELRREGHKITGFGDMNSKELADIANMNIEEAIMAKERDFDEPFVYEGPADKLPALLKSIEEKGFSFTQGRFFHILGRSNKGTAVSILIDLYKIKHKGIKTIALGDSPNDIPMLEKVDIPLIVQKEDGSYDAGIYLPNLIKAEGVGPMGWNRAVGDLVRRTFAE
jgi:mannosyl-3-phosphoglycerate phosphatase